MPYAKPLSRYEPHRGKGEEIIRAAGGRLLHEHADDRKHIHALWQVGQRLVITTVTPESRPGAGDGAHWHFVQGAGTTWTAFEAEIKELAEVKS